jgi:hypothetical protein
MPAAASLVLISLRNAASKSKTFFPDTPRSSKWVRPSSRHVAICSSSFGEISSAKPDSFSGSVVSFGMGQMVGVAAV